MPCIDGIRVCSNNLMFRGEVDMPFALLMCFSSCIYLYNQVDYKVDVYTLARAFRSGYSILMGEPSGDGELQRQWIGQNR